MNISYSCYRLSFGGYLMVKLFNYTFAEISYRLEILESYL